MAPLSLNAHCQVPCGIYDDHARVEAMAEDAATVIKAVNDEPARRQNRPTITTTNGSLGHQ